MKHSVFINENNYIEIIYDGNITIEDNQVALQKLSDLITEQEDKKAKVKILVDVSKAKEVDDAVIALSKLAIRDLEYDKIATFGGNEYSKGNYEQVTSGRSDLQNKVRRFDTKEQAEEWLKED